jgi:hypothetical protein
LGSRFWPNSPLTKFAQKGAAVVILLGATMDDIGQNSTEIADNTGLIEALK